MQNHQPLAPLSEGVRGRKMAPTGGNRSWSEEEVSITINTTQSTTNLVQGNLFATDPNAEDALQAHRSPPQENRTSMSATLPPIVSWQPSTETYRFSLFVV